MSGPIFIGGAPRSGLTLLRVMLDAHPAISCGPDTGHVALTMTSADFETTLGALHREHFHLETDIVRRNFAQAIAAPMEKRAAALGKMRWADKSAFNILVFERLAQLFPEARFLHVVRDGRDLAASLLERQWRDPSGKLFDQCASLAGAARYWASLVTRGLQAEADPSIAGRIIRIRYEDLAAKPDEALQQVCAFLGEPFERQMASIETRRPALAGLELEAAERLQRPVDTSAVGRWRRDLRQEDARSVHAAYRPLFETLGYPAA
jgi:protein-tyrosine sulfotransferase